MAKISDYTEGSPAQPGDYLVVARGSTTRKVTVSSIDDPIATAHGAATEAAFEFDTASLTGLTALSPTPDQEAAHTVIPGHYSIRDDASSDAWCGRYMAAPAAPFTAVTKLIGTPRENYNEGCLFIGEATPGAMELISWGAAARAIQTARWSSPTALVGGFGTASYWSDSQPPIWLAIVVNASNDVDYLVSLDGLTWRASQLTRDPGITIGSVGIACKSTNAGGVIFAWDFLRVWDSALTFPGVV